MKLAYTAAMLTVVMVTGVRTAHAGDLNPPAGPVGSTMKTLDEVEPRTPLSQADVPITITAPGSYVLTSSLAPTAGGQTAITIDASDVTIDLRGFSIMPVGLTAFSRGIAVTGTRANIEIRNGVIRGTFGDGIDTSSANGVRLADLRISNQGGRGIEAGTRTMVENVVAHNNFDAGVFVGNNSVIRNTIAENNGSGFFVGDGSVIQNCVASNNDGRGFDIGDDASVTGCSASDNGGIGIITQENVSVANSVAVRNAPRPASSSAPAQPQATAPHATMSRSASTRRSAAASRLWIAPPMATGPQASVWRPGQPCATARPVRMTSPDSP